MLRQKYGKFIVGARPIKIREYTTMNNNHRYRAYTVPGQLILLRLFASLTSET